MKPAVYIETTIPSYYTSLPSRDVVVAGHQATTRDWWDNRLFHFRIFISQIVLDEAGSGDAEFAQKRLELLRNFPLLDLSEDAIGLAGRLIDRGPIPQKAVRDALHIAVAAVHGVDFLVTWNCAHMANAEMTGELLAICDDYGVHCPVICTPEELMGV